MNTLNAIFSGCSRGIERIVDPCDSTIIVNKTDIAIDPTNDYVLVGPPFICMYYLKWP